MQPAPLADVEGLARYEAALDAACTAVRQLPGVEEIVLLGLGLGATLAPQGGGGRAPGPGGARPSLPVVKGRTLSAHASFRRVRR
ncbi:MAG: hypothetical protein HPM95_04895 [Alphaproteobacteria bacterium]|nr:hypothetical protein [Alphaproteobacteria bacterium]